MTSAAFPREHSEKLPDFFGFTFSTYGNIKPDGPSVTNSKMTAPVALELNTLAQGDSSLRRRDGCTECRRKKVKVFDLSKYFSFSFLVLSIDDKKRN